MGLIGKAVQWVFITPVLYSDGARSPLWYVTMAILARLTALVDLLILAVLALPLAAVFVNPGWGGYLYFRFCHAVYGGDIRKIGPRVPAVPGLDICADSGQDDESADEKKRRGGEGTETESPPLYPNTRRSLIPWSPAPEGRLKRPSTPRDRILYVCNHRSWGDFYIDRHILGYQATYLSRWMVAIVCPVATAVMGFGGPYKSVLFFARKKKGFDRVEFMKMLDQHFEESIHGGLIAYVEGTRNQRRIPKRLKSGVIQYSYDRKIRAQVIICEGKERILNEKYFATRLGRTLTLTCGPVIDPQDFESFEEYYAAVKLSFVKHWSLVYGLTKDEITSFLHDPKQMDNNAGEPPKDVIEEFGFDVSQRAAQHRRQTASLYSPRFISPCFWRKPSISMMFLRVVQIIMWAILAVLIVTYLVY